jgi:hypothetical protein
VVTIPSHQEGKRSGWNLAGGGTEGARDALRGLAKAAGWQGGLGRLPDPFLPRAQ